VAEQDRHDRSGDPQDRKAVTRTIRNVDASVWGISSIAVGILAIVALALLVLHGREPSQGSRGGDNRTQATTPAPEAVPEKSK
jgi:hypothetical protein